MELSRLQTFRMREIVFFGTSEFVVEHRDWWIEAFARMLRDWKARFRFVAATDPFFLASSAQKRAYQSMRKLKYECQLHIPHTDQWVAVASFNNHEASLTDAYGLREDAGEGPSRTHSGCVGFGYDRLVYALLCQFGLDSSRWPKALGDFFGEAAKPAAAWTV
ncbi:MAG: hypothetical protein JSS35_01075 [Proteobacteria bacterium]|nr:hypothetical protein [Pseudomonadota bacterium]